jgi:endogenous inhibitor of DNA gyrase (YacG/DUF329 family)
MRCPICGTEFDPAQSTAKPFCSDRCRSIDLRRWLDETYSLPTVPDPVADELRVGDAPRNTTKGEPHDDSRVHLPAADRRGSSSPSHAAAAGL